MKDKQPEEVIEYLENVNDFLTRKNQVLIAALEYYADPKNARNIAMIDRGALARQVLEV